MEGRLCDFVSQSGLISQSPPLASKSLVDSSSLSALDESSHERPNNF